MDAHVKGQVDNTIPLVQAHLQHAGQVAGGKMGSTGALDATGASH